MSQDSCPEILSFKSNENFQIEKIEKLFFEFQNENLNIQASFFSRIQEIIKEIQEISCMILNKKLESVGFELENKVKIIQDSIRDQEHLSSKLQEFLKSTELFLSEIKE